MSNRPPAFRPLHHRIEEGVLVAIVALLLLLSFSQILLRNIFGVTLLWADAAVKHIVLWASFIGALIATRTGRHIRIDALLRFLPPSVRASVERLSDLIASLVCALLAWHGTRFVLDERSMDLGDAFLGLPRWIAQLIFPAVFGAMALRFLWRSAGGVPPDTDRA
ncbi:MAG: TRAP transporter small permease [Candidatus Latescibacterota bacterium]|nr:TRAP transporter small permease [Candidatus Latescibacterota bacterium]